MSRPPLSDKIGPPLLERFSLEGVHGYKTISASFEHNVKIIAAPNGAGKTTLLNALYALLNGKIDRLAAIPFAALRIKFTGQPEIVASKEQLVLPPEKMALPLLELSAILPPDELDSPTLKEVALIAAVESLATTAAHPGFFQMRHHIRTGSPILYANLKHAATRFFPQETLKVYQQVFHAKASWSLLFLPTYRRIESNFERPVDYRSEHWWDAHRLMFFGMQDVNDWLQGLAQTIKDHTLQAYNEITSRTLSQLLQPVATYSTITFDDAIVKQLVIAFARLGKTGSEEEQQVLRLIANGEIEQPQHQELRNFLGRLLEIRQSSQWLEQRISTFVATVDAYFVQAGAENRFVYDETRVEVTVQNRYTGQSVDLNELSSGEKQIISTLARLYLQTDTKYLVLIDEPELSLSVEWQQRFLPDVFAAPGCAQLIAITHSPFVFDNALEPWAGSLEIQYPPQ